VKGQTSQLRPNSLISISLLLLLKVYCYSLSSLQFSLKTMTVSTVNKDIVTLRELPAHGARSKSGARFSLRKRSIKDEREMVNLSSYNSDFLSGLFADVAKVSVLNEFGIEQKRGSELIAPDECDSPCASATPSTEMMMPATKKLRLSMAKFTGRNYRPSCMNLSDLSEEVNSPKGITELFSPSSSSAATTIEEPALERQDSLEFQLHCVSTTTSSQDTSTSSSDESPKPQKTVMDAGKIVFPHLPATVSDSSCSAGLTRAKLDRQASTSENEAKESFGWFVDLEGESATPELSVGLPYTVSTGDLAFQASTAPKRVNDDAELEWAKAADTVDDVLGDFF
jgi:hypothetical protein